MRTRRIRLIWAGGVAAVAVAAVVATAIATSGGNGFRGTLEGYQEVPAVSTDATGAFRAKIRDGGQSIDYTLRYSGIEDVTQAHIHFGQSGVNGGISVWLCSNLASPPTPAGTPACPQNEATLTGTITSAEVVGPSVQGIAAGELAELVRAIRRGVTYANVHSTTFGGGEIRMQLGGKGGHFRGGHGTKRGR